jgi:hypothetical protein
MPYITLSSKEYSRLPELCPRPISRPIVSPDTSRIKSLTCFTTFDPSTVSPRLDLTASCKEFVDLAWRLDVSLSLSVLV